MKTFTIKRKYKSGFSSELSKRPLDTVKLHVNDLEGVEDLLEITITRDDEK